MNPSQVIWLVFGGIVLLVAIAAAVAITVVPRFRKRDAAFLLAAACFFGGLLVASIATPDWNPVTMAALYAPFLAIGIYAAIVSAARRRTVA